MIDWVRNHLSLNAWCQWRYINTGPEITFIKLGIDVAWGHYVALDVSLLGFAASLAYYPRGKYGPGSWGWMLGQAVGGYVDPDALKVPVESLGREA